MVFLESYFGDVPHKANERMWKGKGERNLRKLINKKILSRSNPLILNKIQEFYKRDLPKKPPLLRFIL